MSGSLVQEKVNQAVGILRELNIDAWLTFVHETSANGDPVLPLIYGHDLTWQSALILTQTGETYAIVGTFEADTAQRTGAYSTVISYNESVRRSLLHTLERIYPAKIAINYSTDDVLADGLSHGLYLLLLRYFEETPWENRLISAEEIVRALRGRKTPTEVGRIRSAVGSALQIFDQTFRFVTPGKTEKELANFMHQQVEKLSLDTAWEKSGCPIVNTGPNSPIGHVEPTELEVQLGHIVHIDFGVKQDEYCSDLQRVAYVLKPGETTAPEPVQRGFETVVRAIDKAVQALKPGIEGWQIDKIARDEVVQAGYPQYMHALGHQLGRLAHDGAGLLGPSWEKYGKIVYYPIEEDQVFTIEPSLVVPGYGLIGIEENILVTADGAEYLGKPQTELILIQ
jgi:Xaa-Pro aminopeptidase